MRQTRRKWKRESTTISLQGDDDDSEMIAKQREEQYKLLLKGTMLKTKGETL